jgi:aspartate-semialdehyde dehydrogenase
MIDLILALIGASEAAGREVLALLEERGFPAKQLRLLATPETLSGEAVSLRGEEVREDLLGQSAFRGIHIAVFAAGASEARRFGRVAAADAVVIDATGTFAADYPVIVPELNAGHIPKTPAILASPTPAVVALALALAPLQAAAGVRRVVVSTYHGASGLGRRGIEELSAQSRAVFAGEESEPDLFPHRLAFNVIPHIDAFETEGTARGYTREEARIAAETPRVLQNPRLDVTATAARVPVFVGVALSVNVQLERGLAIEKAREALAAAPAVRLVDEPAFHLYPLPAEAAGRDDVYVGRLRLDPTIPHGLHLWIVADDLRRGVGLNVVGIIEALMERHRP